jgi:hypothetical protein
MARLEFESLALRFTPKKRRSDRTKIPIRARPHSATKAAEWPEFVQRQFPQGRYILVTRIPSQGTNRPECLIALGQFLARNLGKEAFGNDPR